MNAKKEQEARVAAMRLVLDHYRRDTVSPIFITPEILREYHYQLKDVDRVVVFIGFDINSPLMIPTGTHFKQDVWVVESIYRSAIDVTIEGDMYFMDTEIRLRYGTDIVINTHPLAEVKGIHRFDAVSWEHWKSEKIRTRLMGNKAVRVFHNETDAKVLQQKFRDVFLALPTFPLKDFIKLLPSVKLLYNKNKGLHKVVGDIIIKGPYRYTIPENLLFTGDVSHLDYIQQDYPSTTRIEGGKIEMLSYFNYADNNP